MHGLHRSVDLAASAVLALLGVGVIYAASRLDGGNDTDVLGPRTFPILLGFGLLACGLVLLSMTLAAFVRRDNEERHHPQENYSRTPTNRLRVAAALAMIVIYIAALPTIGFLITTIAFTTAIMIIQGAARIRSLVGTAVLFPTALYVIFTTVLGIRLPPGVFDPVALLGGSM